MTNNTFGFKGLLHKVHIVQNSVCKYDVNNYCVMYTYHKAQLEAVVIIG